MGAACGQMILDTPSLRCVAPTTWARNVHLVHPVNAFLNPSHGDGHDLWHSGFTLRFWKDA